MANSLTLAEKYLKLLDIKFKYDAFTSRLEVDNALTSGFDEAGTIKILEMLLTGLGNYDRAAGFPEGTVTTVWKSHTIDFDRAQSFDVDIMDDAESLNMVSINVIKEFMEQHVIPEVDATRFARMASLAGNSVSEDPTTATILTSFDTAMETMDEAEVPQAGRIMYMRSPIYTIFKNADKIDRAIRVDQDAAGKTVQRDVQEIDGVEIIRVPSSRFYSEVTLEDGTGDVWGYSKTAVTGRDLNFLLCHPSYVNAITRHQKPRVFDADTNQKKDADLFQYRIYHDLIIAANKVNAVYASVATV